MNNRTVRVDLGKRSYDIVIGAGLLNAVGEMVDALPHQGKLAVVTERNVAHHHLASLEQSLSQRGFAVSTLVLDPGEGTKDWTNLQKTVEWLLENRIERDDLVVAFGGGVIGDLVGFAAAILRRGVRFVQIPTSLLAQVDSSVGGKTGINSVAGKNLIGAFHQPELVIADISLLNTLTPRDFLSGYGEVAKYGLLGDQTFFEWLESSTDKLAARDENTIARAVERSCQMKADIVARDEKERGDRALLNLGHTFGHALEAATGYSDRLLHGEAVAIGCGMAFDLSMRMGRCAQEVPGRVRAHFRDMGMTAELGDIPGEAPAPDQLFELMFQDKKVRAGKLTFILARDIGAAYVEPDADMDAVKAVLGDAFLLAQKA